MICQLSNYSKTTYYYLVALPFLHHLLCFEQPRSLTRSHSYGENTSTTVKIMAKEKHKEHTWKQYQCKIFSGK